MCVIAIKPTGIDVPKDELLKAMWDTNKDGAGYMYTLDGKVNISKGFMKFDDLSQSLDLLNRALSAKNTSMKDIPMVFHFRITTHGGTSPQNTHPFPVSDNVEHLTALEVTSPMGVAHNGVISAVDKETTISDTMVFIRDVLFPLSKITSDYPKTFEKLIKYIISYSRLAFLNSNGDIYTIGDFVEPTPKDGILYSNLNHVRKPVSKTYYKESRSNWSWENYDEYYSEDEQKWGHKSYSSFKQGTVVEATDYARSLYSGSAYYKNRFQKGLRYVVVSAFSGWAYFIPLKDGVTLDNYTDEAYIDKKFYEQTYYFKEVTVSDCACDDNQVSKTTTCEHPQKNRIGGKCNEETRLLNQNAERTLYIRSRQSTFGLFKVKKGTYLSSHLLLDIKELATNKSIPYDEKYISAIALKDDSFYYDYDSGCFYYYNADGSFTELDFSKVSLFVNVEVNSSGTPIKIVGYSSPEDLATSTSTPSSMIGFNGYVTFKDVFVYNMIIGGDSKVDYELTE